MRLRAQPHSVPDERPEADAQWRVLITVIECPRKHDISGVIDPVEVEIIPGLGAGRAKAGIG